MPGGGDPGSGGNPGGGHPGGGNPGGGNPGGTGGGRVVGYFTNWAQHRPGNCKFTAANVDPTLLTHLNYAFAYHEIAPLTSGGGWQKSFDPATGTPYAWDTTGGILSYDDAQSFALKLDYLAQQKLGGSMI
jgi:GH18 family chitinase